MAELSFNFDLESDVMHPHTIVVRNSNDPWITPKLNKLARLNPHMRIVQLPGDHDDIWLNPKPYIDLLQSN